MRRSKVFFRSLLVILPGLIAVSAVAQSQRVFVSAKNGNDANSCSLTSPCRGFQRAVNVVALGGEVIALDSGGYGVFGVYQSVTVSAPPGIYAGITINAGQVGIEASVVGPLSVAFRGLSLTNFGGYGGIHILSLNGATVRIDSCTMDGDGSGGTYGVFAGSIATTIITQCIIRHFFAGVSAGGTGSSQAIVVVDQSRVTDCNDGIAAFDYGDVAVRNSVVENSLFGLLVYTQPGGGIARMVAEGCTIARNATGVYAQANGAMAPIPHMYVSNSVITDSTTDGIHALTGAGDVYSFGNNTVVGNAGNENFTNTLAQK